MIDPVKESILKTTKGQEAAFVALGKFLLKLCNGVRYPDSPANAPLNDLLDIFHPFYVGFCKAIIKRVCNFFSYPILSIFLLSPSFPFCFLSLVTFLTILFQGKNKKIPNTDVSNESLLLLKNHLRTNATEILENSHSYSLLHQLILQIEDRIDVEEVSEATPQASIPTKRPKSIIGGGGDPFFSLQFLLSLDGKVSFLLFFASLLFFLNVISFTTFASFFLCLTLFTSFSFSRNLLETASLFLLKKKEKGSLVIAMILPYPLKQVPQRIFG